MRYRPSGVLESITISSAYMKQFSSAPFGNIIGDGDISHKLPAVSLIINIFKKEGTKGTPLSDTFSIVEAFSSVIFNFYRSKSFRVHIFNQV